MFRGTFLKLDLNKLGEHFGNIRGTVILFPLKNPKVCTNYTKLNLSKPYLVKLAKTKTP